LLRDEVKEVQEVEEVKEERAGDPVGPLAFG
jgi:hypothetical protein